ncbi:MAG: hypothetical protein IJ763_04890 [Lachnospiraceae bacterium]|nr:hypothetical protein [Lachnospiraceae bacterium]
MLSFDAFILLMASGWFWTTGEFLAFAGAYLFVQGKLGGVLKTIFKYILIVVIVFVIVTIAGLYILHHKTNPKTVATVTNVVNSDVIGGYYQKLTVEFTYDDTKYVVKDMDTSNLLAEVGDKYVVHFSSHNPYDIDHIEADDKLPTPFQAFLSSIKYAIIGIIIFLILANVVKRKL